MKPPNAFRAWLDAKGLTYTKFCTVTGLDYPTVSKWGQCDRVPHKLARRRVKRFYPDCPVISDRQLNVEPLGPTINTGPTDAPAGMEP